MNALVGYTGFVGSNIYAMGDFDGAYNTKNISQSFGTNPELLIYSGLRAEKYLANTNPSKDMELILEAEENIKKINPKKLVLISTVDVFKNPNLATEKSSIDTEGLGAYGYNRYLLEEWVRVNYEDATIIRLPGLFGNNIKKNFIYDMINIIPFMLKEEKYIELSSKETILEKYYTRQDNGFYKVTDLTKDEKENLKKLFLGIGFSALNFTDSRSSYQFYNLKNLWDDINTCLKNDIHLWHPATEPVTAGELYTFVTGREFVNELSSPIAQYDYRTIYDKVFGGTNGYISSKDKICKEIKAFIENYAG